MYIQCLRRDQFKGSESMYMMSIQIFCKEWAYYRVNDFIIFKSIEKYLKLKPTSRSLTLTSTIKRQYLNPYGQDHMFALHGLLQNKVLNYFRPAKP